MKKIFSVLFLVVVVCFSVSAGKKTIVNEKLLIPKCTIAPVIDGTLDPVWKNVTAIPLLKYEGGPADSLLSPYPEHFTTYRVMWDEENFYAFVHVIDDSICTGDAAAPWNNDCVEIFFDGKNRKETAYDSLCVQWRWVYGITDTTTVYPISGGFRGPGTWAWARTAVGYNLELQIPKEQLRRADTVSQMFPLQADWELGFEISNADRDNDVVGRETVNHWWATDGTTWANPSLFGTAVLADRPVGEKMFIKYTSTPIEIDGIKGEEWNGADEFTAELFEGFPNDSLMMKSWGDHFTSFSAMWDENTFYVFAHVIDDSICTGDPAAPWNNDCVEIFFDGKNRKETAYDSLCVQWRWVYGVTDTTTIYPISGGFRGPGTWVWTRTDVGFDLELAIPKAQLRRADTVSQMFPLQTDWELGFELSNADRDNDVVGRTSVRHWWATDGTTWANPSLFGTAVLVGGPGNGVARENQSTIRSFTLEQNYPNPFNPSTEIAFTLAKSANVKLEVYNLLGKKVAELVNGQREAGFNKVTFNAKNLASGIYFYRLETGNSVLAKKMMLLK